MNRTKTALPAYKIGELSYSIRRSSRINATRIVVKADKIEVVAPPKMPERQIKAFVAQQQDWINAALLRVTEQTQAIPKLAPANYAQGVHIPYLGQQLVLQIEPVNGSRLHIRHTDNAVLQVYLPVSMAAQGSELIRLALTRWMKLQARQHAERLIAQHAPRFGLIPRSLRIKTQKSRWGSCGPDNDINLNWLLMLTPPQVLEYVVVHELCHIRHKNHSAEFWSLVAQHLPEYQQQRRWLKQHGSSVMQGL